MLKMQAIGHLGKDALVNNVNGNNVINFSVAHTEKYKDGQGNAQEKTIWVDCSYWTEKTAVAPYLKKGTQVYVEGSPEVRQWEGKDGKAGVSLTLRVQSVQLLGGGNKEQTPVTNNYAETVKNLNPNPAAISKEVPTGPLPF